MKKKKRGRPVGTEEYPKDMFLKFVSIHPKTTKDITIEIQKNTPFKRIEWHTVQKFLTILRKEDRIRGRKAGRVNIWYL